ncbi:MAG: hypothetical protein PUJ21_06600 [Clostridia bacterium]|nr:hypothetical protein [Clostridia bacterium]MDY6184424.1 hypothetical protein [Eubacteriales bacterium]
MKKILSGLLCLVLAAVLMFSFVSCGEDDLVTPPPTGDATGDTNGGENGGGTTSNSTPKVSEVLTGVSAALKEKDAVTLNASVYLDMAGSGKNEVAALTLRVSADNNIYAQIAADGEEYVLCCFDGTVYVNETLLTADEEEVTVFTPVFSLEEEDRAKVAEIVDNIFGAFASDDETETDTDSLSTDMTVTANGNGGYTLSYEADLTKEVNALILILRSYMNKTVSETIANVFPKEQVTVVLEMMNGMTFSDFLALADEKIGAETVDEIIMMLLGMTRDDFPEELGEMSVLHVLMMMLGREYTELDASDIAAFVDYLPEMLTGILCENAGMDPDAKLGEIPLGESGMTVGELVNNLTFTAIKVNCAFTVDGNYLPVGLKAEASVGVAMGMVTVAVSAGVEVTVSFEDVTVTEPTPVVTLPTTDSYLVENEDGTTDLYIYCENGDFEIADLANSITIISGTCNGGIEWEGDAIVLKDVTLSEEESEYAYIVLIDFTATVDGAEVIYQEMVTVDSPVIPDEPIEDAPIEDAPIVPPVEGDPTLTE